VAAGCTSILVRTGRQGGLLDSMLAALDGAAANTQVVDDLGAAAALLLAPSIEAPASAAPAAPHPHFEKSCE
jgi:hypothetical protein